MATRSVKVYNRGQYTEVSGLASWEYSQSRVLWLGLQNYALNEPLIERKHNLVPWVWFSFNVIFICLHAQDGLVVYNEELGVYQNQGVLKKWNKANTLLAFCIFLFSVHFFSGITKADSRKGIRIKPLLAKLKGISFLRIKDVLGMPSQVLVTLGTTLKFCSSDNTVMLVLKISQ